jgi:hypothetical protein
MAHNGTSQRIAVFPPDDPAKRPGQLEHIIAGHGDGDIMARRDQGAGDTTRQRILGSKDDHTR